MDHLPQGKADMARVENRIVLEKEASPLFSQGIAKDAGNLVILEHDAHLKAKALKGTAMGAGTVATPLHNVHSRRVKEKVISPKGKACIQ